MGDGGVACVPSQHVMEPFSVCGGKTSKNNGNTTSSSNTTTPTSTSKLSKNPKVKTKMKAKRDNKDKVAVEFSGKREVLDSRNVNSSVKGDNEVECNGKDVNKDEVEEGELGTMDMENGRVLIPEKSFSRKFEVKSEIEKGEFVPSGKWRRGDVEKGEFYPRSAEKGEFYPRSAEKGEFFPDRERWRRSEVAVKDEYDYSRARRYDSGKDKGWNCDREWTPPSAGKYWTDKDKGWKGDREWTPPSGKYSNDKDKSWKGDREWTPPSGKYSNDKDKGWKGDREWTPPSGKYSTDKGWKGDCEWTPPSGKYSNDKEVNRSGIQHNKRPSRYEGSIQDRAPRISSKNVDEEGSFKYELSNGKNHGREFSSGSRWKRHGGDSDGIDRKHRGDFIDYTSSKSRKLSDDGNRSVHSSEKYSRISVERPYKNSSSSFRNVSSDKYSSRHYDSSLSSRNVYDRHVNSPHHLERSPHDRARYQDHQDWSPARRDKSPSDRSRHHDQSKSPYSRSRHYDHSRSPFDRSRHYDHRNRSPSYSERSPQDQDRYHERRDRTPSFAELSPLDRSRPRETTRKSGAIEKRQNFYASKGLEEKDNQKDHNRRDLQSSAKDYKDKSNPDHEDASIAKTLNDQSQKDKLPEVPNANPKEIAFENGVTEEVASMEEDMDICNTPPHVPVVADAVTGKWFYLDHFGVEHGPSRLSDLKRLVDEGLLVSDHFIKHIDSDRWVTVEKAASPLVTANFPSIVSETVTELVSPPEATGNLLADNADAAQSSNQLPDEVSGTPLEPSSMEIPENLLIDQRVGALLEGVTVIPGKELETVGEVLQMTFENREWERWGNREGEQYDLAIGEGLSSVSELASGEAADSGSTLLAPFEKDRAVASGDTDEWFSGSWSCRGGDWRRSDETIQDRSLKKRLVLNDGYPLCQMPKFGYEDPRVQKKDELYYPSQSRRLDLPAWAFTSPDEWHDRSNQIKLALGRGVKGTMLSVIRINACVVKDHGSFVSEPRTKVRGKERYPSKASLPYLSTGDMKRLSEESVPLSKRVHEPDTEGVWKTRTSLDIPKDHVCTADELQLHIGDWYYLDGFGHEHGPLTFRELQILANQGLIQKHSSVFRKVDRIWVPVSSFAESSPPTGQTKHENNVTSTSGALLSESSSAVQIGSNRVSSMFHDLHPQFIGYTRGKLHELVMKSYKSREFAAAINEFLDPWISARQPKKEIEKNIYNSSFFQKSDQFRASKRARIDGSEEDYDMEDLSANMKDDFDDLCGDATFSKEDNVESESEGDSCCVLDGRVLARVFHFLRADTRSLVNATLTCKSWRSVVKFYKSISTQVDLCSVGDSCNDSMIWSIMNDYDKGKISSLILRGCTSITSGLLEEVLRSCPHLSLIDIRGCSQFEDLACKYPSVNWVRSRTTHSKIRSLKQIEDGASSALKTYNALDSHVDESSGLRNYLESSDRRDSANQLFHRSLYKRSKLFDARKTSAILSRDAHLRRLAMRKYESGYKKMAEFLASSVKDIMKQNTFDFFVPKVAQIESRIRNGYYAGRGLSSMKDDISRMCREAIKLKKRNNGKDMNRIITLFIRLATNLDGGSKSLYERDEMMQNSKEDSPPGFSSAPSKYRKALNKVTEKRYMNRSNGSLTNGVSDYGEYASDREIRRRLSKLNKKHIVSGSETPDDFDRSSEESTSGSESTASETESDLESQSEGGIGESRGEAYITSDDGFDSLADDREWGARMTKASLVPPVTRKYEVIDNYVIVADEDEVKRKMQVSLPDDYADKLIAQRNGIEDMDFPEVKDYKPRKQLGTEVLEQEVYGIDPYTHNLLLDSMPEDPDWSLLDKHMFIEDVLLRTLNKQVRTFTGIENVPMTYPLRPSFEELLETAEEENDRRTLKLCQYVLKAIDSRPDDKYVAYRKGLGVVCNKEGGFSEEDFVVEFLGEVYPTWKWYEKQDGIRLLQKNSKDPAPEFYNIYLERPKGDADGYDLVVVDAMHKANYASRICHSCRPNCEAKVTAVAGQYQIGIYTVRPIQYGEEITFDYNSVTESKEEYEASVCLCGSQVCRGSYLNLTGEGAFLKVLMEYHGILDRLHLMLEACEVNSVSEEDYIDLCKAGLGSCLLGGLPDWLIAYSARLVRFINFERTKLPDEILKHNLEEKKKYFSDICCDVEKCDAEVQAEGVYNQRLQNLALTLDKVRYVMKCVYGDPKKAPPPLERLNPKAVVSFLWNGEGSLVEDLIQCIDPHMDDNTLTNLKAKIRAHEPSGGDNSQMELRKSLIWLRDEVRNLQCTYKCRHDAAADLIHIYAHTKCFFRIKEYKTVTSPSVFISPLDLGPKTAEKVGPNGHEYSKTYNENYCLGQLIFWYNQAYAEPDSCLARASRGCLSLPDIGSFYAKVQKPSRQRIYGPRTVKFMLARMEKQPQRPWPKERIWSFNSSPKIIGSPMLDAVLEKAPLDKEMVHWLKHRPAIFQAMWDR